jgi:hypothetical protein
MARSGDPTLDRGAWLLAASAAAGLCVSLFDYFWPNTGIDGTPGALLVVVSSALVLGAALLMALHRSKALWLRAFLNVSTLLGVVGTGAAAYFLEADVLLAFMAVGLVGWCWHMILGPRERDRMPAAPAHSGAL